MSAIIDLFEITIGSMQIYATHDVSQINLCTQFLTNLLTRFC